MKLLPHLPGYETEDIRPRSVVLVGVGLFATVLVFLAVVACVLWWLRPMDRAVPEIETEQLRAGPRLEIDPKQDAQRLHAEAARRLQAYGWTDRKAGEAHIPINRAIELLSAKGWPDADTGKEGQ